MVRSIITRLVLLVTMLITVAALWLASQQDLTVDLDHLHLELFEQMVSTNVAGASAQQRSLMMHRLDRAFRLGADWQEPLLELDEPAWTQFRENLFELLHDWMIDRANTYHEIKERGGRGLRKRQQRYVDHQIDTATAWIAAAPDTEPSGALGRLPRAFQIRTELFARVQSWTNEAEGDEQVRISAFTQALFRRALARQGERMSAPGD